MSISTYILAVLLLINFIVRLVHITVLRNFAAFMVMLFIPIFAAIPVLLEKDKFKIRENFFFLNYGWGKGIFCWLLFFLLLGAGNTDPASNDTVTSIFLFIFGISNPMFSFLHHDAELKFVEEKIKTLKLDREKEADIEERKAQAKEEAIKNGKNNQSN